MNRIAMKENAKRVIRNRVFISFLVLFVLSLITSLPQTIFARSNTPWVGTIIGIVVFIAVIPMQNGAYLYFLNISLGKNENFSDLFTPYKNGAVNELIKAKLIVLAYVILGTICFVIPGIYFAIKYAMVDYIFAENPRATSAQAIAESAAIMKGKIWSYFVLILSFFLWFLLIGITFGIAAIYVMPYFYATTTQFYLANKRTVVVEEDAFSKTFGKEADIEITPPESDNDFNISNATDAVVKNEKESGDSQ